jgi:plasmid stabilization system protein ParE
MSVKPLPVVVSPLAEGDLNEAYDWAAKKAPLISVVEEWYARFLAYLQTLGTSPDMYPLASESRRSKVLLRETYFGQRGASRYRIILRVDKDRVVIMRIRKGSRRGLSQKEIDRLQGE